MQFDTLECGIFLAALACALAPPYALGQAASSTSAPHGVSAAAPAAETVEVIREIDDPATGDRWLLVRDWNRPGGPGRLLLLAGSPRAVASPASHKDSGGSEGPTIAAPAAPVIHANDPLVVEENTPIVEARLAATALGPAARGAFFEARLAIGGRIVRVRALSPGRATLEPGLAAEPETQP
jgi:hypothetical protein